uniref:Uncharacterized protein n=1 Tax=Romanomermis culicivorax TaxID=13658 RepID=A0A915I8V6_ROMCU
MKSSPKEYAKNIRGVFCFEVCASIWLTLANVIEYQNPKFFARYVPELFTIFRSKSKCREIMLLYAVTMIIVRYNPPQARLLA